jgi:hypothetical protein
MLEILFSSAVTEILQLILLDERYAATHEPVSSPVRQDAPLKSAHSHFETQISLGLLLPLC